MKTYFKIIQIAQQSLLAISILILCTLPTALVFNPDWFTMDKITWLYAISHFTLFLVMIIRPLADLIRNVVWLRPLVILRKGMGVLSAAIIVSFLLETLITNGSSYIASMGTSAYWSLTNLALFAHLADISAVLLLITSNNLSKQLLGKNWKRIQRLSYVYFYGSSFYVLFVLEDNSVIAYIVIVTLLTFLAFLRNHNFLFQTSKQQ